MQMIGILLAVLGLYGLFDAKRVIGILDRNFYKRDRTPTKKNMLVTRLLALLWIVIGVLIALKSM